MRRFATDRWRRGAQRRAEVLACVLLAVVTELRPDRFQVGEDRSSRRAGIGELRSCGTRDGLAGEQPSSERLRGYSHLVPKVIAYVLFALVAEESHDVLKLGVGLASWWR